MSGKVIPIQEAVAKIPDGATVSIRGVWMVLPDGLLAAIGESYETTGHPRALTATFLLSPGGTKDQPGIEHLARPGLLRRVIGGSFPCTSGTLPPSGAKPKFCHSRHRRSFSRAVPTHSAESNSPNDVPLENVNAQA